MTREQIIDRFVAGEFIPVASLTQLGTDIAKTVGAVIDEAISEFSLDSPREVVATGTLTGATITLADWSADQPQVCRVVEIEMPSGQFPKSTIDASEFTNVAGTVTLADAQVNAAYRVTYKTAHTVDSIPASQIPAFCQLVCSYLYTRLAVKHVESRRPDISADSVDYRSKSDIYRSLSKDAYAEYERKLGLPVGHRKTVIAASATVSYTNSTSNFPTW